MAKAQRDPTLKLVDQACAEITAAKKQIQHARGYSVMSISIYDRDRDELERMVAELKARGWRRANASQLIRIALRRLIVESIDVKALNGEFDG